MYLYVALGWVLWCSLHSTLISVTVTEYLKRKLGKGFRFYRLFYNAVSLLTLLPLMYYSVAIRGESVFLWKGPLVIIKYLLVATSIFLFIAGGRHYSMSRFLGIQQIKGGHADHALSEHETFVISGIHRMIRHPWYLGGIIILWSRDLSLSTILNNIVIASYFIIGTIQEERKLVREFGDQYREYQKNVSMLFPYKWLRGKITGAPQTLAP